MEAINPALNEMIARGQLTTSKIADLIRLRVLVERFATRPYLDAAEVQALQAKFGTTPDVISYGDYFQSEVGSRYFQLSDDEFSRIVDTVRFDLISAIKIFRGKPAAFFESAREAGETAYAIPEAAWTYDQEEAAHLFVLCNYYRDLGLERTALSQADEDWFHGFVEETGSAVG